MAKQLLTKQNTNTNTNNRRAHTASDEHAAASDTHDDVLVEQHVEVAAALARLEELEREAMLADEVEAEAILVEHRQSQRLGAHVVVADAVVDERLVPHRVQRLVDRLRPQLRRLKWTGKDGGGGAARGCQRHAERY